MTNARWTRRPRGLAARTPLLQVVAEIGADRAMTPGELSAVARRDPRAVQSCWSAYERQWARFCGAHLDPQFWQLAHPAMLTGTPMIDDATPVVVVGTGPSLDAGLENLRRYRDAVYLFTSPRGADRLLEAGITPDLVVVEHQTPLDAQFSVQALSHGPNPWRRAVPWIATDTKTPAALLDGIERERIVVLDPMPSWGLWPATAVAVAMHAGATCVALLGIDLGTLETPDPRQQPLRELLGLLAQDDGIRCVDLGVGAAAKAGWTVGDWNALGATGRRRALTMSRERWSTSEVRQERYARFCYDVAPCIDLARGALDAAGRVRDGDHSAATVQALQTYLDRMLEWSYDAQLRTAVQDGLGCGFLPRFWRTPPNVALGELLWRPVALAAHELVSQHATLAQRLHLERGAA